jgi:16S rRNA C967 or C1407 C5-methylase (RsmB/RsmF family)
MTEPTSIAPFYDYFQRTYGDRWENLLSSLTAPHARTPWIPFPGNEPYFIDAASLLVVDALGIGPDQAVLDLCAAPGGKTLSILGRLSGRGSLVANEYSSPRRLRLQSVIEAHAPEEVRGRVRVVGGDGRKVGMTHPEVFDRVLADVPCSSERHLIEQNEQGVWTEHRSKFIAKKQYALLCSAGLAVKPGGIVVYSTCSISPHENDAVLRRFLDRKEGFILERLENPPPGADATEFGLQILPDTTGIGPMYIARLKKKLKD